MSGSCDFKPLPGGYVCTQCGARSHLPLRRACGMAAYETRIPSLSTAYCPHRGAILGELSSGCCGRPAVLTCAIHGRCTRAAVRVIGAIVLRLLDGATDTLTDDKLPAVCMTCQESPTGKRMIAEHRY
jgi:hypothetical protein